MAKLPLIGDGDFDEQVMKADRPVVVDFQGKECPPCRLMEPILEELADEYANRAIFVSLDVEESPESARAHKVRGIPTFLFFKGGQVVDRVTGALPKRVFKSKVDALLAR